MHLALHATQFVLGLTHAGRTQIPKRVNAIGHIGNLVLGFGLRFSFSAAGCIGGLFSAAATADRKDERHGACDVCQFFDHDNLGCFVFEKISARSCRR